MVTRCQYHLHITRKAMVQGTNLADKQTNKQTVPNVLPTPTDRVGVGSYNTEGRRLTSWLCLSRDVGIRHDCCRRSFHTVHCGSFNGIADRQWT